MYLVSFGLFNSSPRAYPSLHEPYAYLPDVEKHLEVALQEAGMQLSAAEVDGLVLEWRQAVWARVLRDPKRHSDPACAVRLC